MVSVHRYEGEKVRGQFEGEGTSYFKGGHVYKVTLNIVITFCLFFLILRIFVTWFVCLLSYLEVN